MPEGHDVSGRRTQEPSIGSESAALPIGESGSPGRRGGVAGPVPLASALPAGHDSHARRRRTKTWRVSNTTCATC